jgi:hypothetical protein
MLEESERVRGGRGEAKPVRFSNVPAWLSLPYRFLRFINFAAWARWYSRTGVIDNRLRRAVGERPILGGWLRVRFAPYF